jgi:hypothetical protein
LQGDLGLNICEAHAFNTKDRFSLDVFVVNGWTGGGTEELEDVLSRRLQELPPPMVRGASASPPASSREMELRVPQDELDLMAKVCWDMAGWLMGGSGIGGCLWTVVAVVASRAGWLMGVTGISAWVLGGWQRGRRMGVLWVAVEATIGCLGNQRRGGAAVAHGSGVKREACGSQWAQQGGWLSRMALEAGRTMANGWLPGKTTGVGGDC